MSHKIDFKGGGGGGRVTGHKFKPILSIFGFNLRLQVSKGANIMNIYNQAPHLTRIPMGKWQRHN